MSDVNLSSKTFPGEREETFRTHQETRGVVQQAAEAADEGSLQEGGVFRRELVGAVADRAGGRRFHT